MRIGHGYDVHAFEAGDHVTLGGVRIPHTQGIRAHSDGDVVLHALCDALLGALGLGDIGQHFPDTDPRWKGADSRVFLRHCARLVHDHRYRVVNADVTVLAEAPRLGEHRAHGVVLGLLDSTDDLAERGRRAVAMLPVVCQAGSTTAGYVTSCHVTFTVQRSAPGAVTGRSHGPRRSVS